MTGRAKCVPGCTCLKHTPAPKKKCPEGCTCGKHNKQRRINWDDPEVRKTYNREMARKIRAADPEPNREAARRWLARNPYYVKYKMTIAQWQERVEEQNGCCYLCGDALDLRTDLKRRPVHVDHDHSCCPGDRTCGQCIRGLTCPPCNQGIAFFRDDPVRMRRAADALELAQIRLKARRAAQENH